MSVEFQKVVSSNVHSVGHDPASNELHVRFRVKASDGADDAGEPFVYSGVTAETHLAMMGAPSIGVYLNRNIKPTHECRKLAPLVAAPQKRESPSIVFGDVMRRLQLADSYVTNDELVAAIALARDALDPGTMLSLFTEMAAHIFKEK